MNRLGDAPTDLLFGLIALHYDLVAPAVIPAALRALAREPGQTLGEHLVAQGALTTAQRDLVESLSGEYINRHGGDAEKSLAILIGTPSARERLDRLGDPALADTLNPIVSVGATVAREEGLDRGCTTAFSRGGPRFRVLRRHAQGGIGEVFVALDVELNREVALKQMRDRHADDPVSRHRFLVEAEITGALEHPGIVPVYGLGTDDGGRPYYAMRFIKGDSLKEAIDRFHASGVGGGLVADSEPATVPSSAAMPDQDHADVSSGRRNRELELRQLLRRFLDVCNAIEYAHSRGVLHRDIKPGNIIVGKYGETLVVDWGLAKPLGHVEPGQEGGERILVLSSASGSAETLPGSTLGTPAYMSPEQARGELDLLGSRSDGYSLGATLYCLLTGRPPFVGDDVGEVLGKVRRGDFVAPRSLDRAIDPALEAVCLKAMALKPEDRYATSRALADDVERWMADEPVTAWREPLARRARRWARRNRTAVISLAASVLVALAGTAVVLAVQTRANVDLRSANLDLGLANDRVTKANAELKAANGREKLRFDLAMDAIKLFHGEVSEDLLLKEKQFEGLRTKLLRGAADFYGRLEGLLRGRSDRESRKALGAAYGELALLTGAIGDQEAALAVLGKALAVRRALGSEPGADARAKLDVARSLDSAGWFQRKTGDMAGARASYEEARRLAEEADAQGGAAEQAREMLADAYHGIGLVLSDTGDPAGARAAYAKALPIRQKLADANPANAGFLSDLAGTTHNTASNLESQGRKVEALAMFERARSISEMAVRIAGSVPRYQVYLANHHTSIGNLLFETGEPVGARAAYGKAAAIRQKLADANPSVTGFQRDLAISHNNIGLLLSNTGDPPGARAAYGKALAIQQKLADANPSVLEFQQDLARSHNNFGILLTNAGDPAGARAAFGKALAIRQKLADTNPTVAEFQLRLAYSHYTLGWALSQTVDSAGALAAYAKALAIQQKLADANPAVTEFQQELARSHNDIGILLTATGDPAGALSSHRKALAIRQKLADLNPNVPDYRNDLASSHTNTADVLRRFGRNAEARESCERAIAIRESLVRANPAVALYRSDLAVSLRHGGLARLDLGDVAGAAADTRLALEIWYGLPSRSGEEWFKAACCHATLAALAGREGSGVPPGEAPAEAGEAMTHLKKAVGMGYRDRTTYRDETALDPLRDRPGFRLLMMDLAFPAEPFAQ